MPCSQVGKKAYYFFCPNLVPVGPSKMLAPLYRTTSWHGQEDGNLKSLHNRLLSAVNEQKASRKERVDFAVFLFSIFKYWITATMGPIELNYLIKNKFNKNCLM
jgi:hypothetical protein